MSSSSQKLSLLPRASNKKIGKAMHDYAMLQHGDRVLVGVSGGVDSQVLAWVLQNWLAKAPIKYVLKSVYIDNGFWKPAYGGTPPSEQMVAILRGFGMACTVVKARKIPDNERSCFLCARNRRSQLFDLAHEWQMNKVALGHHMDDLVETLFLNMLYSGNISTMVPKQSLFENELAIIRPLAYLEKNDVRRIAEQAGITAIRNYCPVEPETRRERVRELLADIYAREPGAKKSIFQSMKNVRDGYML